MGFKLFFSNLMISSNLIGPIIINPLFLFIFNVNSGSSTPTEKIKKNSGNNKQERKVLFYVSFLILYLYFVSLGPSTRQCNILGCLQNEVT